MSRVHDLVESFDDQRAVQALFAVGRTLLGTEPTPPALDHDAASALDAILGPRRDGVRRPSEGELARAALQVLAADPEGREAISALASGAGTDRFGVVDTTALVTLVLLVLQ